MSKRSVLLISAICYVVVVGSYVKTFCFPGKPSEEDNAIEREEKGFEKR